jgi:hypothetical protein
MGFDKSTMWTEKSVESSDIDIGFVIDVSLDTDNGVFRRYHIRNKPKNDLLIREGEQCL